MVIQGHRCRYQSKARKRLAIRPSDPISYRSKLSHIIVEILDTAVLSPLVRLRLIGKLVADFLFVLIELFFARCYG